MNQIYKVVWSKVKGCYVVVSELTKRSGKKSYRLSESKALLRVVVCTMMMTGCLLPVAIQANVVQGPGASAAGSESVAVGDNAKTESTNKGGVAIGSNAQALGEDMNAEGSTYSAGTIAIGMNSKATANSDIVIGRNAKTIQPDPSFPHKQIKDGSIVIGSESVAYGNTGDVIIGTRAETNIKVKMDNIAHGTNTGQLQYGQGVAIGSGSKTYGTQALAIGADTRAIGNSSLAIGGDDINMARSVLEAAVPQLIPGNGIQKTFLREMNAIGMDKSKLGSAELNTSGKYANTAALGDATTAIGMMSEAFGTGSTAIGINSMTKGVASTGIGIMARSWGKNSVSMGSQVGAYGDNSASIGVSNNVGLDMTNGTISGESSAALGVQNTVYGNSAYAIGGKNTIGSATVTETEVANGNDKDKIKTVTAGTVKGNNSGVFGYNNTVADDNSYVIGNNNAIKKEGTAVNATNAFVIGNNSKASDENTIAVGYKTTASEKGSMALGAEAKASASKGDVALGSGSETAAAVGTASATINGENYNFAGTNPGSTVSIGKAGTERTLTNVAAGRISGTSTDAINGSQLYAVTNALDKGVVYAGDVKEAAAPANIFTRRLGEQTNIVGGITDVSKLTDNNLGVVSDGNDTLTVKLAKDLTGLNTVNATTLKAGDTMINDNGVTINNGPSVTKNGINAGNKQITNVTSGGTTDTNAANIGDVKQAVNNITNTLTTKGLNFKGDDAAVIHKDLGTQLDIKGGATGDLSDNNIGVVSEAGALKLKLAKTLSGLTSAQFIDGGKTTTINGGGVTITPSSGDPTKTVSLTDGGLNNGGNTITNVAAGVNDTDAVNVKQLKDTITANKTVLKDGKNTTVTGSGTSADPYKVNLNDHVTLGTDPAKKIDINGETGIIKAGDKVTIDGTKGNITSGKVTVNGENGTVNGLTNKTWDPNNFTSGQAATEDQLKAVDQKITNTSEELTKKGMDFAGNEGEFHRNLGEKVTIKGEGTKAASEYSGENIKTIADANGNITVKMDKNLKTETIVATGKDGKDGKIGINGKDGKTTNISVTRDGKPGVDGAPGTTTTRIVYQKPDGTNEEVATLNDGMKYGGDTGAVIKKKLNEQVNVIGGITDESKLTTEDNLGVVSDGNNNLKVRMAKDLKGLNSVTTNTLTVGDVKIDNSGINAGNKKITNVAAGDISANSTDAVNGGQLWKTNQTINNIGGAVNELGDRMDRVGAGAAALAALHPLDFDPDDKWDVAAGYGNYKDAHAVAVGAFYRPNEDTMFSVGGSFGGGDNMVNAGVSVKLGQGNHVSTSRVALAKEVEDLKAIVKAQSAEIKAMRGAMQSGVTGMKDVNFPDVPKDHWAYSYVKSLADRGLLEGYPDGEFKGDRSMTRYEFAAIIYRALQNGAPIDSNMAKAIGEFDPEINRIKDLDRTRVDRISGKDNDRHKVERVRVNNESNKETGDYRDIYGSHISPEA
ncbi:ESPR-type extended signal peptide-containing protein [Megasphaera coli]|uniref:ESPR-type extended signal peptide-containing protein n=1 Tax=Colibacter massiliensis TaxID=1852379 RepID=UPI00094EA6A0|nr:ESPR-type extended signal peptide-containing protein [Colibacter massiliensis]